MLAGRPHETAGNGSPRWMTVASRQREGTEPGLQAGSPPPRSVNWAAAAVARLSSVTVPPQRDGTAVPRVSARRIILAFFASARRPIAVSRA